jgi:hypothetical protein
MLRDEDPIPVTFDNEQASRSSVELVSIRHPVVRACVRRFAADPAALRRYGTVGLKSHVADDAVIVVYLAETTGLRPSLELWPIAVRATDGTPVEGIGDTVLAALANGILSDADALDSRQVERAVAAAQSHAAELQHTMEHERRISNEALVDARKAAQQASFDDKLARAAQTLALVQRERRDRSLHRLHEGRIANLRIRREDALAQLDEKRNLAVTIRPVAVVVVRASD